MWLIVLQFYEYQTTAVRDKRFVFFVIFNPSSFRKVSIITRWFHSNAKAFTNLVSQPVPSSFDHKLKFVQEVVWYAWEGKCVFTVGPSGLCAYALLQFERVLHGIREFVFVSSSPSMWCTGQSTMKLAFTESFHFGRSTCWPTWIQRSWHV